MRVSFSNLLMTALLISSCSWSEVITQGQWNNAQGPRYSSFPSEQVFLQGNDFDLSFEGNPTTLTPPTPSSACTNPSTLASTCTYNFTETGSVSGLLGSVVFGGTTYGSNNYTLNLTFNFVGPTITANVLTFANNSFEADADTYVTATGSVDVLSGNTELFSIPLTAQTGSWGFFDSSYTNGQSGAFIQYTFATPEPAPIGFVGAGLLFACWLGRRQRTMRS
jgi:hypothetical protein